MAGETTENKPTTGENKPTTGETTKPPTTGENKPTTGETTENKPTTGETTENKPTTGETTKPPTTGENKPTTGETILAVKTNADKVYADVLDPSVAEVTVEGKNIKIKPLRAGKTKLNISAKTKYGNFENKLIPVNITTKRI